MNSKNLTLQDLLNKKSLKDKDKDRFIDIYVSKLQGNLTFKIPDEDAAMECYDMLDGNYTAKHLKEVYAKIIYNACDVLHNKELHEEFGITDPLDIMKIMFKTKDIINIGTKLIEQTGLTNKDEEVKN